MKYKIFLLLILTAILGLAATQVYFVLLHRATGADIFAEISYSTIIQVVGFFSFAYTLDKSTKAN